MLCSCCHRVFEQQVTHQENSGWHAESRWATSLGVVRRNSSTCVACHAVLRGVVSVESKMGDDHALDMRSVLFSPGSHGGEFMSMPYVTFDAWDAVSRKILCSPDILLEEVKEKESLNLLRKVTSTNTGSPEALGFIKERLETCKTTHKACRAAPIQPPWYPTRLIEFDGTRARLIDTTETPPKGPYVSLSHRWGGAKIIRCIEAKLPGLMQEIPWSELPKTFRDALTTIRALGISYVWIDSLCIIQDSASDWADESKTMLNVYQHGLLNLAATFSECSDSGLFAHRSPTSLISTPFPISNGALAGTFVAAASVLDKELWIPTIDAAPLNARGWVLQERLISPRVAHFTADQVVWDCPSLTAAEAVPSGAQAKPMLVGRGVGAKRGSSLLHVPGRQDKQLGQWGTIAGVYSRCELTVGTDKPIAIAGVVDYLHPLLGADFVAGLWRSQMEMQLCWLADVAGSLVRNGMAPSWSWMGFDGAINTPQHNEYEGYNLNMLADVVGVDGADGEYLGRSLRLHCDLEPVSLEAGPDPRLSGRGMEATMGFDLDTGDGTGEGALFFVPMMAVQDPYIAKMENQSAEVRGLVLELDEETAMYSRRGHVGIQARPSEWSKGHVITIV